MAEAIAVVGIVASIVQLVDFGTRVVSRLEEFRSRLDDVPEALGPIHSQLPLLLGILAKTKEGISAGSIDHGLAEALMPNIHGCQQQIEKLDKLLVSIVPTSSDSRGNRLRKAIISLKQDSEICKIQNAIQTYVSTLTFYCAWSSSSLQSQDTDLLGKIRQWLAPPDPSFNFQKASKQRLPTTGAWFLEGKHFEIWKTKPASWLWLCGSPGCGKTILSSTIIEDILRDCSYNPAKSASYFYFDFNDAAKQDPINMLKSIVSQLIEKCVQIPSSLRLLFTSCDSGQRQVSLQSYLVVLQDIILTLPGAYVILDAIDECTAWSQLLEILETIAGWNIDRLHVIITSRREVEIEDSVSEYIDKENRIFLEAEIVDQDIQKYINHRLLVDKALKRWQRDPRVREEIEATLSKKAQGMFRWAACQLDALGKCLNRAMVQKALRNLPATLDETYDRILDSIDDAYSEYAINILRWLAFSTRPLTVDEVAEVTGINLDREPKFDVDEVLASSQDVARICSSLVTIGTITSAVTFGAWAVEDSSDEGTDDGTHSGPENYVRPAHFSVKEYLLSSRIQRGSAHKYSLQSTVSHDLLSQSCIVYLLRFETDDFPSGDDISELPLAHYAAEFWFRHAQQTDTPSLCLRGLIRRLLLDSHKTYGTLFKLRNCYECYIYDQVYSKTTEKLPDPLYYASSVGLSCAVHDILEATLSYNDKEEQYSSSLVAASYRGHREIAEVLLKYGANINAEAGPYSTALQAASARGHRSVAEVLIKNGANVNAKGGFWDTALQAALYQGHEEIVEMLVANGADVNAKGGYWGNALQAASVQGHQDVARMLIKHGVDVNATVGRWGNALQAASYRGHEEIVDILLQNGAHVNAEGGYWGNALQAASAEGHGSVAEMLVNHGADLNAEGGEHGTALQAASFAGNRKIVEMLLHHGANVNVEGGEYGTALQAASCTGRQEIVEALIGNGTNVNAKGGKYGCALQAALVGGYKEIADLLLKNVATPGVDASNEDEGV